ncbi:Gfo/Idh/MocA family oxidoreductase [Lipingzhangella sp. LS1_29]|uniref:Gfo/Idh/MocA family oxidoreductase n=1 Tax=Lipingzhangella rawalii TaxID=2055835 RepID=A0ABU2HBH7_9ACTN|nr:Gfo/Idh/MocA family oxidoreductase [Lipingzhangella rawalii]MDS1271939.1 Gfo/Idh/MocA family oxidoreductase [Lipingzhangella rawalii]
MSAPSAASAAHAAELRVALLGFGKGGSVFHAPLIDATPGLRLSGVVTGDSARAAAVGHRYPQATVHPSAEHLWERATDYDIAVVTTPNDSHVPLAHAALKSGLAVVVDKPLALDVAEARDLVATAAQREQVLTVYHNRRWDADFQTLWHLVDSGELGRVHRFESRFERWRPEARDSWRDSGPAAAGGGILWDLGPHLVDQAVNLFGPVARVYAELDACRPGVSAEDDAFLALTHRDGTRSHLWASAVAAQRGPRFRVLGDRAAFTIHGMDSQEDRLNQGERPDRPDWGEVLQQHWGELGADGTVRKVPSVRGNYPAFYAGLRDAVAEGEPVPVEPHEVVHGLDVIDAARRSAAAGTAAAVPEPTPLH